MLAKKCFLVGIFTLLSLSLAISAQPVHPATGEPLVIDCLRGTPDAIDGDLSDWNLEAMTPAVLDAVEQLNSGQASWDNVGDCGGAFYMLWDDENIYIAAVVTDDKLSMNKTDGDIWNADCIEVLFSTTDAEAVHSWTNPTIHYQYGFNANNQIWNWCNMDGPGQSVPDYLQAASSITADGYICEVSIPHSEITPLDWSVGSIIGFHPCIDDTDIDNGDTELQMSWIGLAAHDQSLGFGHMVLSADSVPAPEQEVDMEIGFVMQPPVIDGEVDEIWADASTQYFVPLDDPANASGSWQVSYDSENLYVIVDMTDDSLQNDSDGSWQDDSVEVYFDGGNTKLDTPLSGDDHQYTFAWTTDEIQGTNADGYTEGIEHAQVDTDTGWRIEIKLPWLSIQGAAPQAGDLIGIDCYYNDDDDGGDSRENKLLSFSAVEGWNDASQWGTAILADVEVEKTVLFAEDFEGLALGPNVDEELAGDAVWTDTPPEGWIVDESGIPGLGMDETDGVTEWAGWAFADKAWWIEAAGDQDRSLFELGSGIVAVADPDEWDDDERLPIPIAVDPYDTWLTTPDIKIGSAEPGTLELKFDSSWRPEFDDNLHQTANITASFDGGDPVEVMLWESDEASENYKPYATNETVIVKLDAPEGAKKLVLTFGLFDAGNDWWWAIDNLEVSGVVLDMDPVDPGTNGLVASYALDGDATDSSGNGIDGTINNADTGGLGLDGSVWVDDPVRGTVISFNGTAEGAFVRAGDIPQMTLTNDFTWSFWANHSEENTADNDIILGNRMSEDVVDFVPRQFIKFTPTKFEWHMNGNGDDNMEYDDIPAGVWLHHSVVKAGDQLTYYRNGIEGGSGTITQPLDFPQPLYFGGDNEAAEGENWSGLMSGVGIYDRALSEAEVRYLAGQRAIPVDPGNDGLVAFYAFENDATDSSGNELHGTLVGDAGFAEGPAGYGMALNLDGVGDYVDCGAPPLLDITEEITFTFWIKAVALDKGWNTVLSRGDDSWRSSRAGTENFMEAAVGGTSGNYLFGKTLVDDDKWHHVGAVYDGATFALYVNGELDGSEESTGSITVSSYPLYIGNNSQNTDREWTGLIDEVIIYDRALSTGEVRYLAGKRLMDDLFGPDVTGLGDVVKGVPDELRDGSVAGWPDGEYSGLAVDDDVSTKFLHFRGEVSPTGFVVEPASGESIVTGLTFTTANDAIERDPISFELSGSNESIDGPYELIASGDIVDFAQEDAWPRFTMNATPISFENGVAYKYYQVMFPAVRDPGSANSMQIAEVELRVSKF